VTPVVPRATRPRWRDRSCRFPYDPRTARATWTTLVILGALELLYCVSVGRGHRRRPDRLAPPAGPRDPSRGGREAESPKHLLVRPRRGGTQRYACISAPSTGPAVTRC
jgi:hypothetical protein